MSYISSKASFPIKIGEKAYRHSLLVACSGRPGGWVTSVCNPENSHVVGDAIEKFKEFLPKNRTDIRIELQGFDDCSIFYENIDFRADAYAVQRGLWISTELLSPKTMPDSYFYNTLLDDVEFFVSGNYSIDWIPSSGPGSADTPFIDSFEIINMGYVNNQTKRSTTLFSAR